MAFLVATPELGKHACFSLMLGLMLVLMTSCCHTFDQISIETKSCFDRHRWEKKISAEERESCLAPVRKGWTGIGPKALITAAHRIHKNGILNEQGKPTGVPFEGMVGDCCIYPGYSRNDRDFAPDIALCEVPQFLSYDYYENIDLSSNQAPEYLMMYRKPREEPHVFHAKACILGSGEILKVDSHISPGDSGSAGFVLVNGSMPIKKDDFCPENAPFDKALGAVITDWCCSRGSCRHRCGLVTRTNSQSVSKWIKDWITGKRDCWCEKKDGGGSCRVEQASKVKVCTYGWEDQPKETIPNKCLLKPKSDSTNRREVNAPTSPQSP